MKIFNISARNLTMISASALFLTFGSFAATSCSSDDDNSENTGGNTSGIERNYQITQAGAYNFNYNEKGAIASISYEDEPMMAFDKDKNIILFDDAEVKVKVSYDSKGRITGASAKETYNYEDESGTATISLKATYNGNYLASIKSEMFDEWRDEDGKESEEEIVETKFNWKNDLLTSFTTVWKEKENGKDDDSGSNEATFSYDKPDAVNKLQQPFLAMFDYVDGLKEILQPLGVLGFFGNGPAIMPTKITNKEYENGSLEEEYFVDLRFIFNEDGTIRSEHKIMSWGWDETSEYHYAGTAARSIAGKQQSAKRFAITPLHLRKR